MPVRATVVSALSIVHVATLEVILKLMEGSRGDGGGGNDLSATFTAVVLVSFAIMSVRAPLTTAMTVAAKEHLDVEETKETRQEKERAFARRNRRDSREAAEQFVLGLMAPKPAGTVPGSDAGQQS